MNKIYYYFISKQSFPHKAKSQHQSPTKKYIFSLIAQTLIIVIECLVWVQSLADVESVETVSRLGVDPESADSIDIGSHILSGSADGAPGNSLTIDDPVADVHGLIIVAGARIASLILVDHTVDQVLSVGIHSGSLLASSDEDVVLASGGGEELEEEVRPVSVDLVDTGEGCDQVLVGDPDEPAVPDGVALDGDEEALSGGAVEVVHVLLDVLGVGLNVALVEAAGGVGEIDEGGDLFRPDSSAAEVAELQGSSGGGQLGGLRLSDGHCQGGGDDCQDQESCLHFKQYVDQQSGGAFEFKYHNKEPKKQHKRDKVWKFKFSSFR